MQNKKETQTADTILDGLRQSSPTGVLQTDTLLLSTMFPFHFSQIQITLETHLLNVFLQEKNIHNHI